MKLVSKILIELGPTIIIAPIINFSLITIQVNFIINIIISNVIQYYIIKRTFFIKITVD